jgi:hypothetical protein
MGIIYELSFGILFRMVAASAPAWARRNRSMPFRWTGLRLPSGIEAAWDQILQ